MELVNTKPAIIPPPRIDISTDTLKEYMRIAFISGAHVERFGVLSLNAQFEEWYKKRYPKYKNIVK